MCLCVFVCVVSLRNVFDLCPRVYLQVKESALLYSVLKSLGGSWKSDFSAANLCLNQYSLSNHLKNKRLLPSGGGALLQRGGVRGTEKEREGEKMRERKIRVKSKKTEQGEWERRESKSMDFNYTHGREAAKRVKYREREREREGRWKCIDGRGTKETQRERETSHNAFIPRLHQSHNFFT